jgi:aromatic-amino-acid transaminase
MLEELGRVQPGSIGLLHACRPNHTGVDMSAGQWSDVLSRLLDRQLIAFVDMAYQGFDAE